MNVKIIFFKDVHLIYSTLILVIFLWVEGPTKMPNIDLNVPSTYHVNCVGGITGNTPVIQSKQETVP